jgi:hypothetical protein
MGQIWASLTCDRKVQGIIWGCPGIGSAIEGAIASVDPSVGHRTQREVILGWTIVGLQWILGLFFVSTCQSLHFPTPYTPFLALSLSFSSTFLAHSVCACMHVSMSLIFIRSVFQSLGIFILSQLITSGVTLEHGPGKTGDIKNT